MGGVKNFSCTIISNAPSTFNIFLCLWIFTVYCVAHVVYCFVATVQSCLFIHAQIAFILSQLSVAYYDLGQPHRSIELLERALKINKNVHGPAHISVAIMMSNMSAAYCRLGEATKSKELAEEALKITEDLYGSAHPGRSSKHTQSTSINVLCTHTVMVTLDVAISLGVLGTTYCDLGELSKAELLLQKSVDINMTVNGPKHIGTGVAQTLLGRVERLAGKLESARKTLESALEIKEAVHGSDHPGELLQFD